MVTFRFLLIPLATLGFILLTSFPLQAQTNFALEGGNKFTAKLLSEYCQMSNFLNKNDDEESTGFIKVK